jgi:uncharacterized protein YrrD
MTTLTKNDIKQSELLNQLVLDFDTTEIVGHVKKLWLDVKAHQVKGLTCTHGMFDREKHTFSWEKVVTVGHDSILVNTENQETVEQLESNDNVIGLKVWTDAGNKVGKLVDYCINIQTGAVVAYLFTSNGWKGIANGTYLLSPDAVITFGSQRIIMAEASIEDAQQYEEGLNKKIQHTKEFIQDDIAKSQSDFGVAVQNTQKATSGLQAKAQHRTEVAIEKLSNAAKQLQHKTKKASSQEGEKLAESETKIVNGLDSSEETSVQSILANTDSEVDTEKTSRI